jgi:hypothetical protein
MPVETSLALHLSSPFVDFMQALPCRDHWALCACMCVCGFHMQSHICAACTAAVPEAGRGLRCPSTLCGTSYLQSQLMTRWLLLLFACCCLPAAVCLLLLTAVWCRLW